MKKRRVALIFLGVHAFLHFFFFLFILLVFFPFLIWTSSFIHPFFSKIFLTEKMFGMMIIFPPYFFHI